MPLDDTNPPPGFTLDRSAVIAPQGFTIDRSSATAPPGFTVDPTPAPQWTQEKPYRIELGKTPDAAVQALPGGSWVQFPGETAPRQKAMPKPERLEVSVAPDTQAPYDLSDFPPPPKPPGWIGTFLEATKKGAVEVGTNILQAPTAFAERKPEEADTSPVGKLLSESIGEGYTDPKWWLAAAGQGVGSMAPVAGLGAA